MSVLLPFRHILQHGSFTALKAIAASTMRHFPSTLERVSSAPHLPTTLTHHNVCLQPTYLQDLQLRYFHQSQIQHAGVEVKVPALGESISDGAVATLLKQPGEQVAEDEPIMQIETDKVTIDVRAPQAGVLERFLVKESDNVVVGQPIATIASEDAHPAPQAAAEAPSPPSSTPPAELPSVSKEQHPHYKQQPTPRALNNPPSQLPKRQPSIKFPPRRTEAGEAISSMPAAQAMAYIEAITKAAEAAAKPRPTIAPPFTRTSAPPPRPPRQLVRPPPALKISISEKEMEAIMLGGAD